MDGPTIHQDFKEQCKTALVRQRWNLPRLARIGDSCSPFGANQYQGRLVETSKNVKNLKRPHPRRPANGR
jgi:hypothetical protein